MNLLNDLTSLSILNYYCLNYPKIDNKKEIDSIKGTITKLKKYQEKDINELIGINPIWNLLNRNAKKDLISNMIDYIEISIDEKYNIKIENIVFNNIFL